MPVFSAPDSNGEDNTVQLREYNPHHDKIGRFTSRAGGGAALSALSQIPALNDLDVLDAAAHILENAETDSERRYALELAQARVYSERTKKLGDTVTRNTNSDGTYTMARLALHERILDEYRAIHAAKYGRLPQTDLAEPTAVFLAGLPGAGKSTATNRLDKDNAVICDADALKELLPEYNGLNAAEVHRESAYLSDRLAAEALYSRSNVILDGTLKSLGTIGAGVDDGALGKLTAYRGAGFRTEMILVDVELNQSVERVIGRFMQERAIKGIGRWIPIDWLRATMIHPEYGNRPRSSFNIARTTKLHGKPLLDAWIKYDGMTGREVESSGTHRLGV